MNMKQIAPIYLCFILLLPLMFVEKVEARRGFGFSRSMGRSFGGSRVFSRGSSRGRSSWGSRSKSGYRRKGGIFGSRKSSRGKNFSNRRSGLSRNRRGQRMLSRNKSSRTSRNTRASQYKNRYRQPTTVINNNYYGGGFGGLGWGMRSVGIWDLFFLSTVNQMFWHHHWRDPGIQRALYQDNMLQKEELKKLEQKVAELERQGVKREPNYLPKDVDSDLAYSKQYVKANPGEFYQSKTHPPEQKESSFGAGAFLNSFFLLGIGYLFFVRRF